MKLFSKRGGLWLSMAALLALASCVSKEEKKGSQTKEGDKVAETSQQEEQKASTGMPVEVQALAKAYPDFLGQDCYADNKIKLRDGTEIEYDDGKKKGFEETLDNCDVQDMFVPAYSVQTPPPHQHDPGRQRSETLFKKMYGSSESAVRKNLVDVKWFGETVQFNSRNGAADSLRAVARELESRPELHKYLKSSGTFYWRPVRGANRLSAHSYGIAFDVGVDHSDYWRWKNSGADENTKIGYANRIPRELVDIFERHGFIWGGAWYHYDTMHFEFRPDLLIHRNILKHNK